MTRATDYTNEAQQRLLRLIDLLAGHELQGLAPAAIAKALGCSPSVVTKDMANLQAAGWAEREPVNNNWRLGPHLIRMSIRHALALNTARQAFDDIVQRYSRT
ncbi:MAG: IclR family transcriptional regulator [Curvibacter lanceolatus]|uniref:IclR family transcriptional regulator n=1 Tax=Curvibacter lanceolatus TaxID=86182 RepID=UPI00235668CC|nr:IclR family transcriptional regulator [Curvibacter lanceolatus]MBV5296314.1 IclR family transcriptional regulator [Curvibacter lanceolatus]